MVERLFPSRACFAMVRCRSADTARSSSSCDAYNGILCHLLQFDVLDSGMVSEWSVGENDTCNPCGTRKKDSDGARWFGDSLTANFSCGTVDDIMPLAWCESFTHVYGMVAEIVVKRPIKFVVYDNVCVLRRCAKNVQKKSPSACPSVTYLTISTR